MINITELSELPEIIEDEIFSIEEYEIIDTIDIEVESKNKLFFANDILTHNCGWDTNDLGINAIAESAGLLHTVDLLFGIVTNAEMKSRGEYFLKCLANRVAGLENTRKRYTMDWKYARIEEDNNSPIQDLDFITNSLNNPTKQPRAQFNNTSYIDAVINKNNFDMSDELHPQISNPEINITGKGLFNV